MVQISPATAQQLGVSDGEWVELRRGAQTASYPAVVLPGLVNSAVAIPAGAAGALALLATSTEALSGARIYGGHQVELRGLKRQERLPRLEGSSDQQGRELARRVSGRETLAVPAIARATLEPVHLHPKHRWAMAIDLDSCNGCQACVVACYAENNLGILGPEQVAIGRTMSWIRMDRFYAPPEPNVPTKVSFLPVLCQQCCEAPCETVCPVDATFHTAEGLNAQVYNRCVGTRYCANNCPYKARVFNYADHSWPAPSNLQLNPDVTVREKGVMEKCTFCVQRIRLGERTAEKEGRPVRDGEVVSACAQTCPAHAITFGDLRDPSSAISKIWGSPRAYGLMEELNTEPGVRYLARVDSDSPPRAEPKPDKEGRP